MPVSSKNKQVLKAKAHALKPIVMIGRGGVTASVLNEVNIALEHHELIKIKVQCEDRELRREIIAEIEKESQADLIQRIGNIAILYRKKIDT